MNIVRENRPDKTSLIKVTVTESDYKDAVDKTLRGYKRKANIPGFRPGMVPFEMINKMYRKGVLAEETYKIASNACFDYIEKEKIDTIGDVIPATEQAPFDFDKDTEYEFAFEIGEAPAVDITFDAKDKVARYKITSDDKMHDGYRTNFMRKYGRLVEVEKVEKDEALSGTLDNDRINVEDAYVGLVSMSDEERKPFIGRKVGDVMDVDINELYKTPSQRASILQVKEEELAAIDPKFKFTITKIRKFAEPEINDEFFKLAFPDGSVTDAAGLEAYIQGQIERDLNRESDYLLTFQVRKLLLDKANLEMPAEFLKRWLFTVNEGKFTMEQIESDFPQFLEMMRWNLIQKYFAEKLEIKVSPEDALREAKAYAAMQFAQYGMMQVEDEMLGNYATQILSNKEEARKIYDKLFEQKIIEAVIPMIGVTEKKVTPEEFGKMAQEMMK